MMNIYACVGACDEAEEVYHSMQRNGVQPDSTTYLALIRAYMMGSEYDKAEKAIASMENEGISPSCAHFNALLFAFAKKGLIKEAERIYRELRKAGLQPDVQCNRSILRGYMDYGHVEEGISFFERIRACVEADKLIMSMGVHLYRAAGMEPKAEEVLRCINSLGIEYLKNLKVGAKSRLCS